VPRKNQGQKGKLTLRGILIFALIGFLLSQLVPRIPTIVGHGKDTNERQDSCGGAGKALEDIPAEYVKLYRKAGERYGLPWYVLAGIGRAESDHGRNAALNSAGAAGPMQIGVGGAATNNWGGAPRHPAGEKTGGYGVDGNDDGWVDVFDPADAIPAAAKKLRHDGAPVDMRGAIFAYNHSTSYVNKVLGFAAHYAVAACSRPGRAEKAQQVISYATAQLGKSYLWGAEGPNSFDCSGLTLRAYENAGISIQRVSWDQFDQGPRVSRGDEQAGDLAFFNSGPGTSPTHPGHVGIVTGDGWMINAPSKTTVVRFDQYVPPHRKDLVGFTRPK
jgi:peptidoglycan DL-endopeptidase CwlO